MMDPVQEGPTPAPSLDSTGSTGYEGLKDRSCEKFLGFGPLWLLVFLALSLYSIDYSYSWAILVAPQETNFGFDFQISSNRVAGIALLTVSAILKATWVGAWVQCLVITWFCDIHWRPKYPSGKSIMQADDGILNYVEHGSIPYVEGYRPRRCPSGCDFDLTDRVYHCTNRGSCLPVYDHYCEYFRVTVYLRTMKPYLYVLIFLPLDGVFTIATSIAALASGNHLLVVQYVVVLIIATAMVIWFAFYNTQHQLRHLAWSNIVAVERAHNLWNIALRFKDAQGEWRLQPHKFYENPWDLGHRENLLQVFGHQWYQWLFFWWAPDRVSRYGRYADQDLPYADHVLQHRTLFLMPEITGVTIDPPPPSRIQGEATLQATQRRLLNVSRKPTASQAWEILAAKHCPWVLEELMRVEDTILCQKPDQTALPPSVVDFTRAKISPNPVRNPAVPTVPTTTHPSPRTPQPAPDKVSPSLPSRSRKHDKKTFILSAPSLPQCSIDKNTAAAPANAQGKIFVTLIRTPQPAPEKASKVPSSPGLVWSLANVYGR
ncbi:hypothetical protein F5X99DRAFT_432243 [Biscogniauxia marginata]|nr:hypothetical protein F5X99DRAFT_432243 [Biscogniauxia marginata]